jgi:pimeloyl-ACP methyl ester carboxylesterase
MGSKPERDYSFDADFLWFEGGGEPLFLSRPSSDTTLIFIEGFRVMNPVGMHEEWLREFSDHHNINVAAPIIGLQSLPYDQRNREWFFQQDLRSAVQLYDAIHASVPEGHKIVVVGASGGALAAIAIAARREPALTILVAPPPPDPAFPRNVKPSVATAGRWFYRHMDLAATLFPFTVVRLFRTRPGQIPKKAGKGADNIVRGVETNVGQLAEMQRALRWSGATLQRLKSRNIMLLWGSEDETVEPEALRVLAQSLTAANNTIQAVEVPGVGHRVLLGDDGAPARRSILDALARL